MKVYLVEALNPEEKAQVDKWERPHHYFSDHAFKDSTDGHRVYIPLEHPQDSVVKSHVEDHLRRHGYEMHDYVSGIAKDKHGRMVKIGKALGKTDGGHLIEKFTGDPARQAKTAHSDYHVLISRHPHDVAGMTSGCQSWTGKSCMNFKDGSNKSYLESEVRHGTHVAYLVHKQDHDNEKPLARIALKPYHPGYFHEDGPRHDSDDKILRPEHKTYGDAPDAFTYTVNRWVNKHFPGKPDVHAYEKNEHVYNDGNDAPIITPAGVQHVLGVSAPYRYYRNRQDILGVAAETHADPTLLHRLATGKFRDMHHEPIARNPHASYKTLKHILTEGEKSGNLAFNTLAQNTGEGGKKLFHEFIHDPKNKIGDYRYNVNSPNLTSEHAHALLDRFKDHPDVDAIGADISHRLENLDPSVHLKLASLATNTRFIDSSYKIAQNLVDTGHKTAVKKLMDSPIGVVRALAATSKHASREDFMKWASESDSDGNKGSHALSVLRHHEKLAPYVLDHFLHPDQAMSTRVQALSHPSIQSHHIDAALDEGNPDMVSKFYAYAPKLTEDQQVKLVNHPMVHLAGGSFFQRLTGKGVDAAVNHPNSNIRLNAAWHSKLSPKHFDQLINDRHLGVQTGLANQGLDIPAYHLEGIIDAMKKRSQGANSQPPRYPEPLALDNLARHPGMNDHLAHKIFNLTPDLTKSPGLGMDPRTMEHFYNNPGVGERTRIYLAKHNLVHSSTVHTSEHTTDNVLRAAHPHIKSYLKGTYGRTIPE